MKFDGGRCSVVNTKSLILYIGEIEVEFADKELSSLVKVLEAGLSFI